MLFSILNSPNNHIHSESKKRLSFLTLLFAAGEPGVSLGQVPPDKFYPKKVKK